MINSGAMEQAIDLDEEEKFAYGVVETVLWAKYAWQN
jgi:hypothetical protein